MAALTAVYHANLMTTSGLSSAMTNDWPDSTRSSSRVVKGAGSAENLLDHSKVDGASWGAHTNVTVDNGDTKTVTVDGVSSTLCRTEETTTNARHIIVNEVSSAEFALYDVVTMSAVVVQGNGINDVCLGMAAANDRQWFNLDTGSVGNTDGLINFPNGEWIDAGIELIDAGQSAYRIWLTIRPHINYRWHFGLGATSEDWEYAGSTSNYVYCGACQLTHGTVQPFVETTGSKVTGDEGDLKTLGTDVFECCYEDGNGVNIEGLLIQNAYTQLISLNSELDDGSEWGGNQTGQGSETRNYADDAFGATIADRLLNASAYATRADWNLNTGTLTTSAPVVQSGVYRWNDIANPDIVSMVCNDDVSGADDYHVTFNCETLAVGFTTDDATDKGYRYLGDNRFMFWAMNATVAESDFKAQFCPTNFGVSDTWDFSFSDAQFLNDDGHIWRYPIKNTGASHITHNADLVENDAPATFGRINERGTVVVEFKLRQAHGGDYEGATLWSAWDDSAASNYVRIKFRDVSGTPRLSVVRSVAAGSDQGDHLSDISENTAYRVGITWDESDGRIDVSVGSAVDKTWTKATPTGIDWEGLGQLNGTVVPPTFFRMAARWELRASDSELANLIDLDTDLSTATVGQNITVTGLASGAAFGAPEVASTGQGLLPAGLASGAVYGVPQLNHGLTAPGVAGAFTAGAAVVSGGNQSLLPTEMLTGALFGQPVLQNARRRFRYIRLQVKKTHNTGDTATDNHAIRQLEWVDEFGGFWPPVAMTDNVTPAPYVASAPAELNANSGAWRAFDDDFGSGTKDYETNPTTNPTSGGGYHALEYLQIDLGSGNGIHPVQLRYRQQNTPSSMEDYQVWVSGADDFDDEGSAAILWSDHVGDTFNGGTWNTIDLTQWIEVPSHGNVTRFGNAAVDAGIAPLEPAGPVSGVQFGSPTVAFLSTLAAVGFASDLEIGVPLLVPGAITVSPPAVTGTAIGSPTTILEPIKPPGLAGTVIGDPSVTQTPHVIAPGGRFILLPEQAAGRDQAIAGQAGGRAVTMATQSTGRTVTVEGLSTGRVARVVVP